MVDRSTGVVHLVLEVGLPARAAWQAKRMQHVTAPRRRLQRGSRRSWRLPGCSNEGVVLQCFFLRVRVFLFVVVCCSFGVVFCYAFCVLKTLFQIQGHKELVCY